MLADKHNEWIRHKVNQGATNSNASQSKVRLLNCRHGDVNKFNTPPESAAMQGLHNNDNSFSSNQSNRQTRSQQAKHWPLATVAASMMRTSWHHIQYDVTVLVGERRRRRSPKRHTIAAFLLFAIVSMLMQTEALGQTDALPSSPSSTTTTSTTTASIDAATSSMIAAASDQTTAIATSDDGKTNKTIPLTTESPAAPVEQPSSLSNQQQANKLKPVDFTLVDELFATPLDDDELVKRWKHMDSQFQDGIRSILKLIFPQIVAISQDAKVSGDCSGGILKWILSLRNLRSWAIKMLDATGKPNSGIFQGSLTMMGNYGQCLSVRAPDEDEIEVTDQFEEYFRGQYCVIHLRPYLPKKQLFYNLNTTIDSLLRKQYKYYEKTLYDELAEIAIAFQFIDIRLDLCVPSTCNKADIQRVAELLSKKMEFRAKVLRCDIEPRDSDSTLGSMILNDEQSRYWLILPTVSILLTCLSTILACCGKLGFSQDHNNGIKLFLQAFSLQNSFGQLFLSPSREPEKNSNPDQDQFAKPWPLYGLRNVFVIWFIIVQLTIQLKYQYLRESLVLRNMLLNYWPFQIIINTTMIFESLILITAFSYGYSKLESSITQLFSYIWHKYVRIIPSLVTLISVTILTPHLPIVSPVWKNFVDEQAEICRSTGYLNLFFLQNFIAYDKICVPHSWLLCVELQLIALTIPLVALLKRVHKQQKDLATSDNSEQELNKTRSMVDKSVGYLLGETLIELLKSKTGSLASLMILFGTGLNFYIVYTNQLPPTWFNTFPDAEHKNFYFSTYLAKTWTHLSTFILGLLGGHLCRSIIQLRYESSNRARFTISSGSSHSCQVEGVDGAKYNLESCGQSISSTSMNQLQPSASTSTITTSGSPGSCRGLVISVPPTQNAAPTTTTITSCDSAQSSDNNPRACLWQLSAVVCMAGIIFSTYSWSTQELPSPLVSALFDSLSRLIWSMALVGLMIKLCLSASDTQNQGNKNKQSTNFARLFSSRSFILLGRLSLLAYLWAPYVHTFILAVQEQSLFPSLFLIFHVIVGNIVITYVISFIMSLLLEQPFKSALVPSRT